MHLLWPNYMRPLPAFSILQFDPLRGRPGAAGRARYPVEGRPIEDVRCRFRTCYPTEVLPLAWRAELLGQGRRRAAQPASGT
jgi:type VI secretion system protein ImpG